MRTIASSVTAFVILLSGQASLAQTSAAPEDERCLNCHGQISIATSTREERATMVAQPIGPQRDDPWTLFVDQELLLRSSHAKTKCVECHPGAMDLPHPSIQARPTCSTSDCHAAEGPLYARSVHAKGGTVEDEEFPECWTCHGFHDVLPASQRGSRTYPLNVLGLCGGCHEQHSHTAFRSESDLPEHGPRSCSTFVRASMDAAC